MELVLGVPYLFVGESLCKRPSHVDGKVKADFYPNVFVDRDAIDNDLDTILPIMYFSCDGRDTP